MLVYIRSSGISARWVDEAAGYRTPRPSSGSLFAAAYFLLPLLATLIFSLRSRNTGKCCTLRRTGSSSTTRKFVDDR